MKTKKDRMGKKKALEAKKSETIKTPKALEARSKKYGVGGKFGHDLDQRKHKLDYDEFIVE